MSAVVVRLLSREAKDLVAVLEDALEQAKSGRLQEAVFMGVEREGGGIVTSWSSSNNMLNRLGCAARLTDVINRCITAAGETPE